MADTVDNTWQRCSSCKRDIAYGQVYWVCNVSTCNRKRTALSFCTTDCWAAPLGLVNHRESWAVEKRAPSRAAAQGESAATRAPAARTQRPPRRVIVSSPAAKSAGLEVEGLPRDVLIVGSKLKAYIKARSGMNTSDRVMQTLSDEVRKLADRAIRKARHAERKTVLDRDFQS